MQELSETPVESCSRKYPRRGLRGGGGGGGYWLLGESTLEEGAERGPGERTLGEGPGRHKAYQLLPGIEGAR
jgi:hypothetical protein